MKEIKLRIYQQPIVEEMNSSFGELPYVLGAAPGSGKTEMTIKFIIDLFASKKIESVLVLAHSTNLLKENFYSRLLQYFNSEEIGTFQNNEIINPDADIQVMIPQNISKINRHFDLVVVDEAHQNVLVDNTDGLFKRIMKIATPKHTLLLTGTPSKFLNLKEQYNINVVGMDKIGSEYFHNLKIDLVKSDYDLSLSDYNDSLDLKATASIKKSETLTTLNNIINTIVKNIDETSNAKSLYDNNLFGKTLIVCKRIAQANQISKRLNELFGGNKIGVSTSVNDKDSIVFNDFKNNKLDILVVVGRGREGYDDSLLRNIVDLTMTHNIDIIYQMFSRTVRKDESNSNDKMFIKATLSEDNLPTYTRAIVSAALMLTQTKNLEKFNGKNFRDIEIPVFEEKETKETETIERNNNGNKATKTISIELALDLKDMFNDDDTLSRYATTTLGEELDRILYKNLSLEDYIEIAKKHYIKTSGEWSKNCKKIGQISAPWGNFNLSAKDFTEKLGFYLSLEEHIEIAKENKILKSVEWTKQYKKISDRIYSAPWKVFKITYKEFGNMINPKLSLEEHIEIAKENNIKTSKDFSVFTYTSDENLYKNPWLVFNITKREFIDMINPKLSLEEHIQLGKENGITTYREWSKNYKKISDNLYAAPGNVFDITVSEFTKMLNN